MAVKFGKYEFAGPYSGARYLYDKKGVYIILCKDIREEDRYYIIDIDESDTVRTSVETHPRKICWTKNCYGIGYISVGVFYEEDKERRKKIIEYIRNLYDIPCG